jgi:Fe-S-cluster-containing dehydrogenase component
MTSLPQTPGPKRLGLVIDLDTCVGCHACATNCKEWNTSGISGPLTDLNAYQAEQRGVWFNRVFTYEAGGQGANARTVHFPKNCLHCEFPACPTSGPKTASSSSTPISASAASCAPGPAPTARASMTRTRA